MTAQSAERLNYRGADVEMYTNPLSDYFHMRGNYPPFRWNSTGLWRCYLGSWKIVADRLYLIGLVANFEDGTDASLATIFPEFPDRVFAHWYTGTIRLPQGKQIHYVHMAYARTYERDLFLEVQRGVIMATRVQHNVGAENPDRKKHFHHFLDTVVVPVRAAIWVLAGWPAAVYMKVKAMLKKKDGAVVEKKGEFAVGRQHLLELLTAQEVEKREVVTDPLKAAPELPFGHLNAAWKEFLDCHADRDELWSFSAQWRQTTWGREELRLGYVVVQNGVPGTHFLTV